MRNNAVLLAKQLATIDRLSAGRLTVGIPPGARPDDYTAAEVDFHTRGPQLDDDLHRITQTWADDTIGPPTSRPRPTLLLGGTGTTMISLPRRRPVAPHAS